MYTLEVWEVFQAVLTISSFDQRQVSTSTKQKKEFWNISLNSQENTYVIF